MPYVRKSGYKRKAVTRRYKKRYTKRPVGAFKKKVLSVLSAQVEDKMVCYSPDPIALSPTINATSDIKQIVPQIQKGVEANERVGEKIRGKYISIRGHLELNTSQQTNDGPTRVAVRVMIVSPKNLQNWTEISGGSNLGWLSGLIDYGSANQVFDGTTGNATSIKSLYLPLNTDVVTCHHDKLHYLNAPKIVNSTGTQLQNVDWQNTIKFFNIKLNCKKLMKYVGGTLYPNNYSPVMLVGFCQLNGGANSTNFVRVHYLSRFIYEDA